jgi:hypothetical protein
VRESRTPGSVRGVSGDGHSYRDTSAVRPTILETLSLSVTANRESQ